MKDSGSASLVDPDVPDGARYTQSTSTPFRVADCLNILANRPLIKALLYDNGLPLSLL